ALQGIRGRDPVDIPAIEQLMVRFSQLIVEQPWIKETDINPLLVSSEQIIALDARVVLHEPDSNPDELPRPAIRPYPTQYITMWSMKNGTPVRIRPIRPEDEPLVVKFHESLSDRSVYFRYFHLLKLSRRISHERLARICFIDYDREMALVADYRDPATGEHQILGFGRLSKLHGSDEGEFGLLIADPYQGLGLGTKLLQQLVEVGRSEKLVRITADILPDNGAMQHLSQKVGFRLQRHEDVIRAEIDL
ncbi:MAG: GNAT family N-acetyltransferase, partial [Chroococcales cyanobacterium]